MFVNSSSFLLNFSSTRLIRSLVFVLTRYLLYFFIVFVLFSERGCGILVVDGYKYRLDKKLARDRKRWKCANETCKCALKTSFNYEVLEYVNAHNHNKYSEMQLRRMLFINDLKKEISEGMLLSNENASEYLKRRLADESVQQIGLTPNDIISIKKCLQRRFRIKMLKENILNK